MAEHTDEIIPEIPALLICCPGGGVILASIAFQNVTKAFGKTVIVDKLNLTIEDGKFTVLVGPSGCGKTTLLRMIAGLGPQTSGRVLIDGKDVSDIPPGKRGVAMVFQNYAIYPTMSVRENIEFGLKNNKIPKAERARLIAEVCEKVGLSEYLDRSPSTLSGGQRQRIALARAMVKQPSVFLMDEPLSNLDAKLRVQMRVELIELHKRLRTTFVYVTHDQVEAMSMADAIILMNDGVIQQMGSPEEIYKDPNNIFTAQFIGSPPMNVLEVSDSKLYLGFRPERAQLSYEDACDLSFRGVIKTREMLGSETLYKVALESGPAVMVKSENEAFRIDETVSLNLSRKDLYLFDRQQQRIRDDRTSDLIGKDIVLVKEVGSHDKE